MQELTDGRDDGTVVRVAAIDIAKASGMVCLRVPYDTVEGPRVQQVWNVASTTNAIPELGDKLVCQGVQGGHGGDRPLLAALLLPLGGAEGWSAGWSTRGM